MPRSGEAGFTLVEVIVALAIATLALAVLLPWLSEGLVGSKRVETYIEATILAESVLDAIGVAAPLADGQEDDQRKGLFQVHAAVHRFQATDGPAESGGYEIPYELAATVSWQEGPQTRSVSLKTVRLGAPR